MSSTRRRILAAAFAVLGVLVTGAAIAWACTPQANIGVDPGSGMPGTQATVTGSQFASGPVEITWNGGPVLARANGPNFGVTITIPNSPAETHTIVAVGFEQNGAVAGRARASFTIPGAAGSPNSGGGGSADPARSPGGAGTTSGDTTGGEASGGGQTSRGASGGERTTPAPGGAARRTGSGATANGEAAVSSGNSVFADSLAASAGRGEAAISAQAGGRPKSPSARSAAANLWSGFAKGTAPSLGTAAGAVERGSVPALTLALLGLGLTTVLAGIGLAGARRRRAAAGAGDGGEASSD
jgi:hypothetical protein